MSDKPLILIIEDHAFMRDTLIRIVEMEDLRALGVGDGKQVIPAVKKYQPDALILDVDLGGIITGIDVLRYMKSNPNYSHIPVILHTSESGISSVPEAKLADLILLKPADPDDIGRLLKRVLKKHQMAQPEAHAPEEKAESDEKDDPKEKKTRRWWRS